MAATGKTPILLYGSTTATNAPVAGNLTNSSDGCEIAINVADKNLFFKDSTNAVNTVPIRQSSGSSDGWLSSANWTTFNSKQTAYTNLTTIGSLANATGWLYNNGSGTFSYSTPSASDVGAVPTSRTVSTTSPLAGGGALSSNLTLSITQATTSTSGYLSSTDWNTFNNKQPAGTYVTSVTGTAPVVSSGGTTPAISMAAASGSVNGYLTSTDWTTFNNKQPAGSYALTTGTLAQFAATTSAQLAGVISDETGSGSLVFGTSPTFSTSMTLGGTANPYITFATTSSVATNMFQIIGASYTGTPPYNKNRLVCINSSNLAVETAGSESMVVSYTGDVTVSKGNLVIGTSGKGIDFSATAGTGTSELLADYEEGTWTPTYLGSSSNPTITYYVQQGVYVKTGNQVFFTAEIWTSAVSGGSGTLLIGGLPYTAYNARYVGCANVGYAYYFTTQSPTTGTIWQGTTSIDLYAAAAAGFSSITVANLTNGASKNIIVISGSYRTA